MSAAVLSLIFVSSATVAVEPEVKISEEILPAEDAWALPGFRVDVGYGVDSVFAPDFLPDGLVHSVWVRAGARLDSHWSLLGSLRYGVIPGEFPVLRYSGTVDPTLHITDALSFSIGAGVAGFVATNTGAPTPEPEGGIIASYTLSGTDPPLHACQGAGMIALVRADYRFVLSDLVAMGPSLQADTQWTGCTESFGRADPDTGDPIVLRQFWPHHGISLAWLFAWR